MKTSYVPMGLIVVSALGLLLTGCTPKVTTDTAAAAAAAKPKAAPSTTVTASKRSASPQMDADALPEGARTGPPDYSSHPGGVPHKQ